MTATKVLKSMQLKWVKSTLWKSGKEVPPDASKTGVAWRSGVTSTKERSMLTVDKGVPLPEKRSSKSEKTKHLHDVLDVMEVGDSVEFPIDRVRGDCKEPYSKDGESLYYIAIRKRGFKMTRRLSNDRKTIRFWRTE
jgi:hypothetical protein